MTRASSNMWNSTDALLALASALDIHRTDIGVQNCATRLLSKCDDSVRQNILQPIINSQQPGEMVRKALTALVV